MGCVCPGGSVRGVLSWSRHSAFRGRCGRGRGIHRFEIQRQDPAGNKVGSPQGTRDVYSCEIGAPEGVSRDEGKQPKNRGGVRVGCASVVRWERLGRTSEGSGPEGAEELL